MSEPESATIAKEVNELPTQKYEVCFCGDFSALEWIALGQLVSFCGKRITELTVKAL